MEASKPSPVHTPPLAGAQSGEPMPGFLRRPAAKLSWWQVGAPLLAGLAATLALSVWLPLPASDPLRSTIVALPLVLAGLVLIALLAGRGLRPAAVTRAELAALAALVLIALGRQRLGLGLGAPVVAGGLALLLFVHAARRVVSLRRLLGTTVPHTPHVVFFLLPLVVYLALLPWTTGQRPPDGDEPYYLLVAHSLAFDRDAELTNNYAAGDWESFLGRPLEPQPGDPHGKAGEVYSRHNALLPLVLVPAYVFAGKLGALAAMAAMAAALAWLTLRLGSFYVPDRPGETLIAWGLMVVASPLVLFSTQVWVEVPAALLAMVALEQALRLRSDPVWSRRRWLALAIPVVLLPLLKIRLLLLAAPLLVLAWWHAGRPRRPLLLLSGFLAAVGVSILLFNQAKYGNPLKIHSLDELNLNRYPIAEILLGVSGLFWDSAFGLFAAYPIWLLLLPAIVLLARQRHFLLRDLLLFVSPYLMIVAPRSEWYGGWSPPFRYSLVAMPLLALALVPLLVSRRGASARALFAALAALTLVTAVLWVAMPGWTYNFADGRTYLLDHLASRLDSDVARFFPSSVRWRAATWLWPLATCVLVPLAWWGVRRRWAGAELLGVGLMVLAAASVPLVAKSRATHIVEAEDPWVHKSGGHLHPDQWVVDRTRFRGGWVLREGERLEVPVVSGGTAVALEVDVMFVRNNPNPLILTVRQGGREVATWTAKGDRSWQTLAPRELTWQAGEPLVFELAGEPHRTGMNGLIIDRIRLAWSD